MRSSPGATTTSTEAMRSTCANASNVCSTRGRPASGSYCLGPSVPARVPVPAHGSTAWNRAGESGGWAGMGMERILESTHTPLPRGEGCSHLPHPMDLPKLTPGKRFALPRPPGSADALLLARLAEREKAAGRRTGIVTSGAADAQRLIDELAFFAPDLRVALFPDWETLPYDTFSPHQDLISERRATLWRISQNDDKD